MAGAWIKFFNDAGIPSDVAATYALTFSSNRIRMDMLLDLTKEILRDMGITLMGDVIAILKHAKQVHEQKARDTILLVPPEVPAAKKPTAVEQVVKNSPDIQKPVTAKLSPSLAKRLGPLSSGKQAVKMKTPPVDVVKKDEKTVAAPPPVKKPRRVLPEHEGKYKVIMPSGSTPRTKRILEEQALQVPSKKRTVFERLGDGNVTSTTGAEEPKFTVTCGESIIKSELSDKVMSVFNRLGDKSQVSSSSFTEMMDEGSEEPLEYVGVLKKSAVRKTSGVSDKRVVALYEEEVSSPSPVGTMRADNIKIGKKGVVNRLGQQKKLGISNGIQEAHDSPSNPSVVTKKKVILKKGTKSNSAGILSNPINAVKLNVKQRLGKSGGEPTSAMKTKKVMLKKSPIVPGISEADGGVKGLEQRVTFASSSVLPKPRHTPVTFSRKPTGSITLRTGVFSRLGT
ncbi:uncharacterized protein C19orf47 isoform X2 [Ischnura elegans]|uniref:uncharacterized protein C19orf47 isoform X2 n=1 Tax=Ischnura elegans TaxID=197161 RepID=UPI001ED8AAE1|nr:uncharacterized protein C19orf47 isoform X2 [Ischnura elegans]